MVGLGQVDELEVEGKGTRQAIGLHQVQRVDAIECGGERLRGFRWPVLGFAAANRNLAQLLHFAEELIASLLAQNLAEQHSQRTNIAPQRRFFDVACARFQFRQANRPVLRFPKQSHCL